MNYFNNPHTGFNRPGPQQMVPQHPQQMPNQGYPQQMMPPQYPQQGYPQQFPQQQMPGQFPQQFPNQGYPQQYGPPMMPGQFPQQPMPGQFPNQGYPQQYPPQQMPQIAQPVQVGMPEYSNSSRFGGNKPVPPMTHNTPQNTMQNPQHPAQAPQAPASAPAPVAQLSDIQKVSLLSTGLAVGTRTQAYTEDDFMVGEDGVNIVDCFDEAVEHAVEFFHDDKVDKVTKTDYVIATNVFGVTTSLLADNLDKSPGALATSMKAYMKNVTTKNELMLVLALNAQLTSLVQDILYVNARDDAKIDSFMDDYHDLIGGLTGALEFVSTQLTDKLSCYLQNLQDCHMFCTENETLPANATVIYDKASLFYCDVLDMELNLNMLKVGNIVAVSNVLTSKTHTNALYTLVDCIHKLPTMMSSVKNYIVTYEKNLYEIFSNVHGKYYIKRVA